MKNKLQLPPGKYTFYEVLQKVAKQVANTPRCLDMRGYVTKYSDTACGTVACIAGWTSLYLNPEKDYWDEWQILEEFGCDPDEFSDFVHDWSDPCMSTQLDQDEALAALKAFMDKWEAELREATHTVLDS